MSKEIVYTSDINDTDALISEFFEKNIRLSQEDKVKIKKAWCFLCENTVGKKEADSGEFVYLHPLRVAYILASADFDADCICAGILHEILSYGVSKEMLVENSGETVCKIVVSNERMLSLSVTSKTIKQSDAIRKMLFAMADDVRVIFVKLANGLDRIRNIGTVEDSRKREFAQEVIDIWAPLADRLGMQSIKNEFEDLSLKYTNPSAFLQIKDVISQKKGERAEYLRNAVEKIETQAKNAKIDVKIESRAKHFYSIYQKMRKRNKSADELYDLLALRIICQHKNECYTLVGIVHSLWAPLEGRFKDYIAVPKSNGYQSLHTTVMCEGRPLEIQIRTEKMHQFAEYGVASHWIYKKGMNRDSVDVNNLEIFNHLKQMKNEQISDENFFNEYKNELLADEIVVFTPKGDVKKLPLGACAIDFAYSIHSAVGEKIVGAKADGKIIPLTQPLKNTQIIEIITNPNAHPTESQLKAVKTSKAHQKIHSWLSLNVPDFLAKEDQEKLFLERQRQEQGKNSSESVKKSHKHGEGNRGESVNAGGKIRIGNTTNFFVTFAKCCNPKKGDAISGYVSRTRGITIHKSDCYTYRRIQEVENRSIEVEWDENQ